VLNLDGVYDLQGLPEGSFRLQVESPGFRRGVITDVVSSAARQLCAMFVSMLAVSVTPSKSQAAVPGVETQSSEVSSRTSGTGRRSGPANRMQRRRPLRLRRPRQGGFDVGTYAPRRKPRRRRKHSATYSIQLKQPVTIQKTARLWYPSCNRD